MENTHSLRAGTLSGTLLCIIGNVNGGDIIKSAVLAFVGATVSFLMTCLFRWLEKPKSK